MLSTFVLWCLVSLCPRLGLLVNGYWLMGANNVLTTQRIDPIVTPGTVGSHVHDVLGGSNFGFNLTSERLRQSQCTSIPILEDKSSYWYPRLYFWWANGSFTDVVGNPVIYYLYGNEPGKTTAFPDDFRMISGDPTLRTLKPASFAQQAVTHLCLDFETNTGGRYNELPTRRCPNGIRSQINFPSCWNGKDVDSPDHKSHVSFLSTGPDNGTCTNPKYPVTLPRIFLEVYWYTQGFDDVRNKAMIPQQPFVFSNGDPNGVSFHADFYNGWDKGVLQRAINECNCNPYGDPTCCVAKGVFTMDHQKKCYISESLSERTSGLLTALPGRNPVQKGCFESYQDNTVPAILAPVYVHNGSQPIPTGTMSIPARVTTIPGRPGPPKPRGTCLAVQNSAASQWGRGSWLWGWEMGLAVASLVLGVLM